MASVTLRDICKSYDGTPITRHIDLDIEDGEFVVFVGPSGCGKSTLLRLIAGLEDITSGDLLIGDQRVNDLPPKDRSVGMVFQSYALYPHMTVAENMAFGLKLASVDKREIARRVEAVAEILQLDKLLERKPKDLSGGQRQRVAIGRTMVREPKVFLFDEPLSNLDAFLRVQMRIEIARLHQRIRSTMIYVTHDQVEAMTLADKIVVLNAGEIAQVGQPLHLYHYPQNRFVAGFLGSPQMNFVEVRAVSASPEAVTVELPSGYPLTLPVDGSAVSAGDPLTLGIRPEHFVMPDEADFTFHGQITVAERLGQYNLLYLTLERLQDVITLCVDGNLRVTEGETFAAGLKADKCHLFRENGEACTRHYREPAIYG
ncbi:MULTISPECIES: maltose/maltodextrin ABC transporter ATP-binding protein MalK [Stutzerimonas stutzeri subgroup]|uniref:maltose/maltodextrin ABC transporter ATP-binding protein MalK n=1 Tax=Stutzerimonas stutzeri subgroup TaxID=578833 RepID=UPI0006280BD3|nr:maltose/maltodextrin ABC transporter ATP-binding protein MalK [Stutzerimonas kunmingensis]KKJ94590.1 ABC transporter [Stutzerimonas stutzeri]MCB4795455.1 maltose/maltodextrin ABC transporter ATP-binding protein MalK [Pseudomonas sp. NP21570]RRU75921.1 maltose/maltodextrin ABC transporter ATP-binding protein MalK [Stutzerimonas xanthomarina]